MKACFLVLLAIGAALAAEEAADSAPKAPKARQLPAPTAAAAPGFFGARAYPQAAYYPGAPAQAFASAPYNSAPGYFSSAYPGAYRGAYSGAYPGAYSGAYPGAYSGAYSGAYPGAYSGAYPGAYPGAYSGAYPGAYPGAYSGAYPGAYQGAYQGYAGNQYYAPKKPAYAQSVLPAPAMKATAPAYVAPAYTSPAKPYAPGAYAAPNSVIVRQVLDSNFDGSFTSSYETDQGQVVDSRGFVKNAGTPDEVQVIQGSYSYISPEGQPITTTYIADENGFQVQGDHLPQPHESIVKALAYQASLPAQPQYVAAPAYAAAASAPAPAVVAAKKAL